MIAPRVPVRPRPRRSIGSPPRLDAIAPVTNITQPMTKMREHEREERPGDAEPEMSAAAGPGSRSARRGGARTSSSWPVCSPTATICTNMGGKKPGLACMPSAIVPPALTCWRMVLMAPRVAPVAWRSSISQSRRASMPVRTAVPTRWQKLTRAAGGDGHGGDDFRFRILDFGFEIWSGEEWLVGRWRLRYAYAARFCSACFSVIF